MSVLAHNNKIIIAPNGKALNMQNLINLANATTGKSDTTLLDAIDHLIEGYGSGSFHKESGSVSFHAGANRISPEEDMPVPPTPEEILSQLEAIL